MSHEQERATSGGASGAGAARGHGKEVIVKFVVWLAMIVPDKFLTVLVTAYVPAVHAAGGTVSESVKRRVL